MGRCWGVTGAPLKARGVWYLRGLIGTPCVLASRGRLLACQVCRCNYWSLRLKEGLMSECCFLGSLVMCV